MKDKYKRQVEPRLTEVKVWARNGVGDKDIAKKLVISYNTFLNYRKKYKDLENALLEGKKQACTIIENSLYELAKGGEYTETKITKDEKGKVTEIVEMTKKQAPNITAIKYFLGNKDPENWRDRAEIQQGHTFMNLESGKVEALLNEFKG